MRSNRMRSAFAIIFGGLAAVLLALSLWGVATGAGALGEVWFATDAYSLNLMQAMTQRYLSPAIWDPGVVTILLQPAPLVGGIVAVALGLIAWTIRPR